MLIALLTLAGCGNLAEQNFPPLVIDDANLLSPETKNWITSFPFPRGYALCVRTIDQLPESLIGAKADDLFGQTAEESNEKKALKNVAFSCSYLRNLLFYRLGLATNFMVRPAGVA